MIHFTHTLEVRVARANLGVVLPLEIVVSGYASHGHNPDLANEKGEAGDDRDSA